MTSFSHFFSTLLAVRADQNNMDIIFLKLIGQQELAVGIEMIMIEAKLKP